MENKILFVGGNWDLNGGKESKIVDEFAKYLPNVIVYNGGDYNDLNKILESSINYDTVIWWANVLNELPKIRNVKDINYKTMLVSSKRNIDNKYSFQDLLQRSFALKSNLTIEFSKKNDLYSMKLFDPLGNVWYEGTNIKECAEELIDRLNFIKSITRESTISKEENNGALAWFFNMFKEEIYKSDSNPIMPVKEVFLNLVKEYASKFAEATFETKDVKRFLGNASFRCPKGFPSFRDGNFKGIVLSKNTKDGITKYELKLPTDRMFAAVHGDVKLHYTVYENQKLVMLDTLLPEDILTDGYQKELTTYKGVMVSKSHADRDMFKINLLNMLDK